MFPKRVYTTVIQAIIGAVVMAIVTAPSPSTLLPLAMIGILMWLLVSGRLVPGHLKQHLESPVDPDAAEARRLAVEEIEAIEREAGLDP